VAWETKLVVDRLVDPPATTTELFEAAREKLLEHDWDLAVVVTDLPVRQGGRPVSRRVSASHGVAIVSLPALGALNLRQRLRRTLVDLVRDLVDTEGASLQELAALDVDHSPRGLRMLYVPAVLLGHLRLLTGMVRANRPWRFAARLYSALAAALAAGAVALITGDFWLLSATMGFWRLALSCVLSIGGTVFAIIAVHHLWERAPDPRVREQVVLFNIATTATVLFGIVSLYLALFVLMLGAAELVIRPFVLEEKIGHHAGFGDYLALAWLMASFGAIAGGLGAGLESEEEVREAAYANTPSDEEAG
jgi:hypothetical protein